MNRIASRPLRRLAFHVLLGSASCALIVGFLYCLNSPQMIFKISMATAYGSLFLLALSLMIGPWNVLRSQPNPLSSYLRRDIGIWAGILAIAHVIAGLQVHMDGKMWLYFLSPPELNSFLPVRLDLFGLTNYAGLIAAGIIVMLLCLSNNASIRALGGRRWKSLQRWNYVAATLTCLHGWAYQLLEGRAPGFVLLLTIAVLFTVAAQIAGCRHQRSG